MSGFVWFLALVGFCLIAAEIILPGAILGMLGGVCLMAAIVIAFVTGGPMVGLATLVVIGIGSIVGFVLWLRWFPGSGIGRRMTLQSTVASPDAAIFQPGQSGEALTALRPAGSARINGKKVDVVTAGDFIEAGMEIEIESVAGMRVVVRKRLPSPSTLS